MLVFFLEYINIKYRERELKVFLNCIWSVFLIVKLVKFFLELIYGCFVFKGYDRNFYI